MPTVRSHDREHMEPERHDELSAGVIDATQQPARQERKAGGRGIQRGATAVPSKGGQSRKGSTKLTHEVPSALPVSDTLKRRARYARKRMTTELARGVGGGRCGMLASAFVKLGVEDMAMREQAMADGDRAEARKLGESARMHLLYARETCVKDAGAVARHGEDFASLIAHAVASDIAKATP
jgi:hypothetical protein